MSTWEETSSFRRGQVGLSDAMERLSVAFGSQDGDRFFLAAVEAAMWAVAMDDHLASDDANYTHRRSRDPAGPVLRGLRWARNQGIHNLLSVHRMGAGMTFPLTFPAGFTPFAHWLQRTEVPKGLGHAQ